MLRQIRLDSRGTGPEVALVIECEIIQVLVQYQAHIQKKRVNMSKIHIIPKVQHMHILRKSARFRLMPWVYSFLCLCVCVLQVFA